MWMLVMGVCLGLQPVLSYCHGAGDGARLRQLHRAAARMTVAIGVGVMLLCALFRREFVGLFLREGQAAGYAVRMLTLSLIAWPVSGLSRLYAAEMEAAGRVKRALVYTLLRKAAIPLVCTLAGWGIGGLWGMAAASPVSEVLCAAAGCLLAGKHGGDV